MDIFKLFKSKDKKEGITFVRPSNDDGAIDVDIAENFFDYAAQAVKPFDLDSIPTNEYELINIYRSMSLHQEIDEAIQEIINEAIIIDEMRQSVSIVLDNVDLSDNIKSKIADEFKVILKLLNFKNKGYNYFSKWYIDGKLIFHKVIDSGNGKKGIVDLIPINPLNIKLVRELPVKKDNSTDLTLYDLSGINEYFIYTKTPITSKDRSNTSINKNGVKIPKEAITYCTSGVTDESGTNVLSYLYKAIKPWNNIKLMEDSVIIYRVVRAPERRAFYVDVGNLPKGKAEQYLKDIMNRFKNNVTYDSATGTINNKKSYNSMIEDYWLPRREGGRGTEIDTLPGGQQLGEIEDVNYFKNKLYRSLNVPLSRFQQDSVSFNIGRTSEITRDEVKFSKFINRLRKRFSYIFDDMLKTQLTLKKILSEDEWIEIQDDISYSFLEDNLFSELKEMELLRERIETISLMQQADLIGTDYYTHDWVKKNILKMSQEDIDEMRKQKEEERNELEPEDIPDPNGTNDTTPDEPEVDEPEVDEPEVKQDDKEKDDE